MKENFIVGITGGSASGKTEFVKRILDRFNKLEVCLISQDNYYWPREQQKVDKSSYINFDLPETIDVKTFAEHIGRLKKNQTVNCKEYVFNNAASTAQLIKLNPAPIVIVEGIFVLHYPEIANYLDLKLYVEADSDLMLKRRLTRDQEERGYDFNEIMHRFENHVKPAYEKYILPYRKTADIVVPNYDHYDQAFNVVAEFLRAQLRNVNHKL